MTKPIHHINTNKGFTIVEMALVLTALSVLAAGGLGFVSGKLEVNRINITEKRMSYVMDAIRRFRDENEYLPCPADATLAYDNSAFGDGTESSGCTRENLTSGAILAGAIPINQLDIPPIYMLDGWNRKFLYVVDENLTTHSGYGSNTNIGRIILFNECYDDTTADTAQWEKSAVISRDSSGTLLDPASASAPYDSAYGTAVMLLSFGKNGHGAWKSKGGSTRFDKYTGALVVYELEEENAHLDVTPFDGSFVIAPENTNVDEGVPTSGYVPSCRTNTYYFDDIITHLTKWQLDRIE